MSPGQTGHTTGQMGRVPGTDGTHTRGCPAKILYVYWFFSFPNLELISRSRCGHSCSLQLRGDRIADKNCFGHNFYCIADTDT